jgi:hypothetical protein
MLSSKLARDCPRSIGIAAVINGIAFHSFGISEIFTSLLYCRSPTLVFILIRSTLLARPYSVSSPAVIISFAPGTGFVQLKARGMILSSLSAAVMPGGPSRISTSGLAFSSDLQSATCAIHETAGRASRVRSASPHATHLVARVVSLLSTRTSGECFTRTVCGQTVCHGELISAQGLDGYGAPDKIRTCDLCLRRAALYPAELRARCGRH